MKNTLVLIHALVWLLFISSDANAKDGQARENSESRCRLVSWSLTDPVKARNNESDTDCSLSIGDEHEGGIIFYLDDTGCHGLVCMPEDQGEYDWNKAKAACQKLTYKGFKDWYLPTRNELEMMYKNLRLQKFGHFTKSSYWSSSVTKKGCAWTLDFNYGGDNNRGKYGTYPVRAVRAF